MFYLNLRYYAGSGAKTKLHQFYRKMAFYDTTANSFIGGFAANFQGAVLPYSDRAGPVSWLAVSGGVVVEDIILIAIIVAVILYWWDNRKSGERVLHYCRQKCARENYQLLDASVVRQRSWLRKKPGGGLQVCRLYSFEYSDGSEGRQYGYIVLIGQQVVETGFPPEAGGSPQ